MSASTGQKNASFADWTIADPGDAAAIANDITGTCCLTTGSGGETRTIAAPVREGILITLCMETDGGGDCVVTVTGGLDEAGNTTLTFDNTGEYATLRSIRTDTGTFGWRVADYDGESGITISLPSFTYGDSTKLNFGTSSDITMAWDGTDFDVLQLTADSSIKWGINGAGIDHVFYGDTAGSSMTWDQTADSLIFTDDTLIVFGDASDATIAWNAAALEILPKTDDTGALNVGDGTTDMDFRVFLGTTTEYFECNMGSSNVTVRSAEAAAFSVGLAGPTNPAFEVDASTGSSATGINIKSAAATGGVAIKAISSGTNEPLFIDAKGSGAITIGNSSTGNINLSDVGVVYGEGIQDHGNEAVTATADGLTTGLISTGTKFVTVTCDGATKAISLPAATIGDEIWLQIPATGCELWSAVTDHQVNGVQVGATNELELTALSTYLCKYVLANRWIVRGFTNLGADEAALVPDAR